MDRTNKPTTRQPGESGMTLIEVVISTIILGVVLTALGQALTLGIKLNSESKMRVASLIACKQATENLKTQISQSQGVFDATAPSNSTFFVNKDGNKTYSTTGGQPTEAFTSSSAFRVNVVLSNNNGLTQTVGGVTSVLVKTLEVTVVDIQKIGKSGYEISIKVEIVRPSA
jgi:prepilin-type N-terminal cleavage/methylation domain-containing protein